MTLLEALCAFLQNVAGSEGDSDVKSVVTEWSGVRELADCNNHQILQIAKRVIDKYVEEYEADDDDYEVLKMKDHSDTFLSFLAEKQIDGEMLKGYKREQFGHDVEAFSSNENLDNLSRDLLWELQEYDDVSALVKESMEWKKVSVFTTRNISLSLPYPCKLIQCSIFEYSFKVIRSFTLQRK